MREKQTEQIYWGLPAWIGGWAPEVLELMAVNHTEPIDQVKQDINHYQITKRKITGVYQSRILTNSEFEFVGCAPKFAVVVNLNRTL